MRQNFKKTKSPRYGTIILALIVNFASTPALAAVPGQLSQFQNETRSTSTTLAERCQPGETYMIPISETKFINQQANSTQLDLSYIRSLSEIARADLKMTVKDMVPLDMQATNSQGEVAGRILGFSIDRWLSTNPFAKDTLGAAVQSIEAPLKQEISIGNDSGQKHSIKMDFKATRGLASISYQGLVNARVGYQVIDRKLGVEVSHSLGNRREIVINHSLDSNESREIVAFRMEW
jgi:hypothetical protein